MVKWRNLSSLANLQFKLTLFVTGAAVLLIEILGSRILAPFYGTTIFVWTALITVALGFLALGYYFGGRQVDKNPYAGRLYISIGLAGVWLILIPKLQQPLLNLSDHLGLQYGPLAGSILLFAVPFFLLSQVSPYVIRLIAHKNISHGRTAGSVFALGTFGSLFGALFSVFILLPNLSITTIFRGTGIMLILLSLGFFVREKKYIIPAVLLIISGIILGMPKVASGPAAVANIVREKQSFYGDIKLTQNGNFTCLMVNSTTQTCMVLPKITVDAIYAQEIVSLIATEKPKNILLLGVAGGGILSTIPDDIQVDAVELDPQLINIASQAHMMAKRPVNITYDDARHYIRNHKRKYDMVLVDVFKGQELPVYMFSQEAFKSLNSLLKPSGSMFINVSATPAADTNKLLSSIYKSLASVFGQRVKAVSSEPNQPVDLNFIISKKNASLGKQLNIVNPSIFSADAQLITDHYNPLDFMAIALEQSNLTAVKQTDPGILFVK